MARRSLARATPLAKGLSAPTVVRLKALWQQEYEAWSQRSLRAAVILRKRARDEMTHGHLHR
jgi:hypothetical protein